MSKSLQGFHSPLAAAGRSPWRRAAALILRAASFTLARLARRMRAVRAQCDVLRQPELEFYAEAGAPEGALYINGEYVGRVPGITRL